VAGFSPADLPSQPCINSVLLFISTLDSAKIEAMFAALGDQNIEIDAGKAQVRITCE
jgi:hypothetical protein